MGTSRLKPIFPFSVDKNDINVRQVLRGYRLIISPPQMKNNGNDKCYTVKGD